MKHNLLSITFISLIIFASCALASSQTSGSTSTEGIRSWTQSAPESTNRTTADENFELNITERRITEHDFAASTSVEAGEETARGLLLSVGVALGADEINVLLRNVHGNVRFRATLERVLQRLSTHRAPGAAVP
ncbi:MAG: hypothetical protein QOJ02_995 [Acidobacteriota bacterium]|nr:hypothetical protein [Acidobacteriota bacterium]